MTVLLAKVVQKAVVKVNQFMEQGVKQYIARNISMLQKLELKKEEKILQTLKWGIQNQDQKIILIDHQGSNVLDHCAWFRGHGLKNTLGVDGGIDRYAREVDTSIPRYRLELD
mgnify:CR=1 FL=1